LENFFLFSSRFNVSGSKFNFEPKTRNFEQGGDAARLHGSLRSPDRKPNGIDHDIIPMPNRIQSLKDLTQSRAFQGDNKRQNLVRVFFETIALRQSAQLFGAMSELPDLGNVHRQVPESLADVADDPRTILHNETHIKRARDFFRRLKFQNPSGHKVWKPGESPFPARHPADVPKYSDSGGPPPRTGTDKNIIAIALASRTATFFRFEANGVGGAIDAGKKILASNQCRRYEHLYSLTDPFGNGEVLDGARTGPSSVMKIHPMSIPSSFAPPSTPLTLSHNT